MNNHDIKQIEKEEIMKLYKEIIVLRKEHITLRNQLKELNGKHSKKMNKINSLREKDEKYVWCQTHDKKHNKNVISSHGHRIQLIYEECLFAEDHIWMPTGVKKWLQLEDLNEHNKDAVDIYSEMKCMTCELITYRLTSLDIKSRLSTDIEELTDFEGVDFGSHDAILIG